jgi:uncharacterized membrane-anchored protein
MARFWVTAVILLVCLLPAPRVLGQDSSAAAAVGDQQSAAAQEQELANKIDALRWVKGPTTVAIAGNSNLKLPDGYQFLDNNETAKFEELTHNIPGTTEVVVVPPARNWVAYLDFNDAGKVIDDEKIDADKILASLRSNQQAENQERQRRGWAPLEIAGWAVPPVYNSTTKRLEWATLLDSRGHRNVNFSTKILGRRGYTTVILACGLDEQAAAVRELNAVLTGYSFNDGERYSDWVQGDKVAEYGLGALIIGGAAVAAAKSGLLKGALVALAAGWKLVLAGLAAVAAFVRSLFGRKKPAGPT